MLQTFTEQRPTENEHYVEIKLDAEQQLILANDVLASIKENSLQQVLDAALVALNTTKKQNFCTTFDGE